MATSKKQQAFMDEQKAALEAYELPQEPEHVCRRDDPKYASVSDWYRHHIGRVPIMMAWKLDQRMKATGETFAEAWAASVDRGSIILIEPEKPEDRPR
jgi:hypothetical protein